MTTSNQDDDSATTMRMRTRLDAFLTSEERGAMTDEVMTNFVFFCEGAMQRKKPKQAIFLSIAGLIAQNLDPLRLRALYDHLLVVSVQGEEEQGDSTATGSTISSKPSRAGNQLFLLEMPPDLDALDPDDVAQVVDETDQAHVTHVPQQDQHGSAPQEQDQGTNENFGNSDSPIAQMEEERRDPDDLDSNVYGRANIQEPSVENTLDGADIESESELEYSTMSTTAGRSAGGNPQ